MEQKFKFGDRVKAIPKLIASDFGFGTILGFDERRQAYAVRFDHPSPILHNCEGRCEEGHGWYLSEEMCVFANEERKKNGTEI